MKLAPLFLTTAWLGTALFSAHAQVSQVQVWAAACANCHGTHGQARAGMEPLAGKDASELTQKLLDFKNGRQPATVMHQLAKGYSDGQLQALATHFAAQKP